MGRKLFVLGILAIVAIWTVSDANAQERATSSAEGASLLDRLDGLRRRLFGGVLPSTPKKQPASSQPHLQSRQTSAGRTSIPAYRAGSATGTASQRLSSSRIHSQTGAPAYRSDPRFAAGHPSARISGSLLQPQSQSTGSGGLAGQSDASDLSERRLHERLKNFGQPVFSESSRQNSSPSDLGTRVPSASRVEEAAETSAQATAMPNAAPKALAFPRRVTPAPRIAGHVDLGQRSPTRAPAKEPVADVSPTGSPSAGQRVVANTYVGLPSASQPGTPAKPQPSDNLLFTRQSPILSVETSGPRRITVGKESTYQVAIRNSGQVAAEQVVVAIDLPEWAEVVGTEASAGTAGSQATPGQSGGFRWELDRLEAKAEQKLALRVVPRQSRPFELAVRWDYTPAASQAMIEVQEPKLEMRLDGPREVLYGKSEVYRLELVNSGTGDAENVEIALLPVGTGQDLPATHKLGTLLAGQKKAIEVELTARQAGTLTIQVDARGDVGLEAHLTKEVLVYRPALELAVRAPEIQYVGANATYRIDVSNPGTAAAEGIVVTATIPRGAEYVSDVGGARVAPEEGTVTWTLDSLGVGVERTLELTCRLAQAGLSSLEAVSTAKGDLAASGSAAIKVEAMADLALELNDPSGPVPVGSEATYQVRVQNRGTKSAEEVEVVVYFSEGIEPTSVEGGRHQTAPGQVLFDKIASLAPGQDVSFRVNGKAATPGNHVCRVEVYCKPLGIRLLSEETTHFFASRRTSPPSSDSQAAAATSRPPAQPLRTVGRRRPNLASPPGGKTN